MDDNLNFQSYPFDEKPPHGWVITSLKPISENVRPGFASGEHNKEGKGIPHLRPMNINSKGEIDLSEIRYVSPNTNSLRIGKGDILFNNTNSQIWVGKAAVIKEDGEFAFSNHMTRIQVNERHINSEFIAKQLHYLNITGYYQIHCKKHVNQASIASWVLENSVPILIPPFNEQKRIVTKIGELQDRNRRAREALESIPDLLEQLRQSVLAAAFNGDLTKKWREENKGKIEPAAELLKRIRAERRKRWEAAEADKLKGKGFIGDEFGSEFAKRRKQYKEPESVDSTGLAKLPEGWCWCWLSGMGYMNRGKSRHRPRNAPHLYGGPYPFIQTGDISQSNGRIVTHSQTYSEAGLAQSKLWPIGTVCITIAANIASSAILTYPVCFPDSVVGIIPDICPAEYIEYFIRTVRNELEQFAPATAQKNINIGILNNVVIPLAPRKEIDHILQIIQSSFSNIGTTAIAVIEGENRVDLFEQSILRKAFRGELVLQDPSDEPASTLLERIRQERDSQEAGRKVKAKKGRTQMKLKELKQKDILAVLREAAKAMSPKASRG